MSVSNRRGPSSRQRRKVFGVGYFRTGSTTLAECLKILGYRHGGGYVGSMSYESDTIRSDLVPYLPRLLDRASKYDCFEDAPWMFLYEQFDRHFPGSRFILTHRKDTLTFVKSMIGWYLQNEPDAASRAKEFAAHYEEHNRVVREYFDDRPDDYLEICWELGDGWEKLCRFLEEDVPFDKRGVPLILPHANRSPTTWGTVRRIKQGLKRRLPPALLKCYRKLRKREL